jgi:hypothetical protein
VARKTPLERAYRYYNRKYFFNSLPALGEFELRWDDIPGSVMGMCSEDEIVISTKYQREGALWQMTLLHEMCHMKLGTRAGHGPKFQAEMLRLAQAGAFKGNW